MTERSARAPVRIRVYPMICTRTAWGVGGVKTAGRGRDSSLERPDPWPRGRMVVLQRSAIRRLDWVLSAGRDWIGWRQQCFGGGRDFLAPTARKSYLSSPFLRLGRRERSEPGSTGRLLTE